MGLKQNLITKARDSHASLQDVNNKQKLNALKGARSSVKKDTNLQTITLIPGGNTGQKLGLGLNVPAQFMQSIDYTTGMAPKSDAEVRNRQSNRGRSSSKRSSSKGSKRNRTIVHNNDYSHEDDLVNFSGNDMDNE